jgi:hypothetical protein
MSDEELDHLLHEIAAKGNSDPKSVLTLLQLISMSDISLAQIEHTKAEKVMRTLAIIPVSIYCPLQVFREKVKS